MNHINIYDMFYTGPDTEYEDIGQSCQYGGVFIHTIHHNFAKYNVYGSVDIQEMYSKFNEEQSTYWQLLPQLCSDIKHVKYVVRNPFIMISIPYPSYSTYKATLKLKHRLYDFVTHYHTLQCLSDRIIELPILNVNSIGWHRHDFNAIMISLTQNHTLITRVELACGLHIIPITTHGFGQLEIVVNQVLIIDRTFNDLNIRNKSFVDIYVEKHTDFPVDMHTKYSKHKIPNTISHKIKINDALAMYVKLTDPIIARSLHLRLNITAHWVCLPGFTSSHRSFLDQHESLMYARKDERFALFATACHWDLIKKSTGISIQMAANTINKFIRISIYDKNRNLTTTLESICFKEADHSSG